MRAGVPLWIPEPEGAGLAGDIDGGMDQPARQFAGIDFDGDGRGVLGVQAEEDREEERESENMPHGCRPLVVMVPEYREVKRLATGYLALHLLTTPVPPITIALLNVSGVSGRAY